MLYSDFSGIINCNTQAFSVLPSTIYENSIIFKILDSSKRNYTSVFANGNTLNCAKECATLHKNKDLQPRCILPTMDSTSLSRTTISPEVVAVATIYDNSIIFKILNSVKRSYTCVFANGNTLKSAKESAMLHKNKNLKFCIVFGQKMETQT